MPKSYVDWITDELVTIPDLEPFGLIKQNNTPTQKRIYQLLEIEFPAVMGVRDPGPDEDGLEYVPVPKNLVLERLQKLEAMESEDFEYFWFHRYDTAELAPLFMDPSICDRLASLSLWPSDLVPYFLVGFSTLHGNDVPDFLLTDLAHSKAWLSDLIDGGVIDAVEGQYYCPLRLDERQVKRVFPKQIIEHLQTFPRPAHAQLMDRVRSRLDGGTYAMRLSETEVRDKLIVLEAENRELTRQIKALKKDTIHPRTKTSFQRMLIGMLVDKYGFDPTHEGNSKVSGPVERAVENAHLGSMKDTVLKHINEATGDLDYRAIWEEHRR